LAVSSAAFSSVPIFQAYTTYPPCFRQPVLVTIPNAALLVFAEGRNNTFCSGTNDGNIKEINLRRSTDAGATWQPMQTLYTSPVIDFLTAVYDPTTKITFLFIQSGSTQTLLTISTDQGASWSKPTVLVYKQPVSESYPSVGHGIVISGSLCADGTCAGKSGRLVVPYVCHSTSISTGDVACPGCYSCTLYSDDHGQTWQIGAVSTQEGTREASLVQLQSASFQATGAVVYAFERNMGNATGHKEFARSLDAGSTFTAFGNVAIPDSVTANWTGVVSGATRFDTAGTTRVIATTPNVPTARADLAVFLSTDEAQTWSAGAVINSGPSGYSDALQWNTTHVAVVFENGVDEFAAQISFGFVTAADLPQ
jgi:sialidase-1